MKPVRPVPHSSRLAGRTPGNLAGARIGSEFDFRRAGNQPSLP